MVFSILSEYDKELMLYATGVGIRNPQNAIIRKEGFIDYQLFLVTKGSGTVEYKGREFSVSEGEAFFMPKLIPHRYYHIDDEFSTLWVSFDEKHIDDILTRFNFTEPCKFKPSSFSVLTGSIICSYKSKTLQNRTFLPWRVYSLIFFSIESLL